MKRLYRYLPPFAGDYSGICSALYELGGMLCIHDASGCTGNYTGFDEPRSYNSNRLVYCTGLRKTDAILGNEEVYIDKIVRAAKDMNPEFVAIVGSPVPMVIGFDFHGVAKEIESRLQIPVFGFESNGIKGCYKDGIVMAVKRILDYYVPANRQEKVRTGKKVNIIGVTPLDMSSENLAALREEVNEHGYEVNCVLSMENSLEEIKQMPVADVNLAVTQAGVILAIEIEKKYNIPYLAGLPIGEAGGRHYFRCLEQVIKTQKSMEISDMPMEAECPMPKRGQRVVVLEDSIIASSIRLQLLAEGYEQVDVISLFGKDESTSLVHAEVVDGEEDIIRWVNQEGEMLLIADPFILELCERKENVKLLKLPKYAISSKLAHKARWNYIGKGWDCKMKELNYM